MKLSLLAVVAIGMLLPGLPAAAQERHQTPDMLDARFTTRGEIMGQKPFFIMAMPADTFRAAPPIDLTNPKLPKTLKEIADIAFAELEKIKGTRQGWRLTGITLLKVTGRPEFKGRWCYIVHFTDGAWGSAAFPVTVDGRLGTLIDEKDPSVNASGSYREDPEE